MTKNPELDKSLRLIAKSSFVVFTIVLLSNFLAYLYRIIIARHFGPEVYGLFSLAVMIAGWFIVVSLLGFSTGLIRYIPLYRGKKEYAKIKHVFKLSFKISFLLSIAAALVLFFSASFISINIFHNAELALFLKIFAFLIPIAVFSNLFLAAIKGFEKVSWYLLIFNILQDTVKVIALLLFILIGLKITSVIFSYFLGFLMVLLVSYLVCKYKLPQIFGKYYLSKQAKRKINKDFFLYSAPLLFSGLIVNVLFWTDSFFIGRLMDATSVGLYNVAIPIAMLMGFAPGLFTQLFFPMITREFSKGNLKIMKELSQQVGKWIFVINFPIFLLMFLFPGTIINILFGPEYVVAEGPLRILVIGGFISYSFFISQNLLLAIGKSKLILVDMAGALAVSIILNLLLIPRYGLIGAALSSTAARLILGGALFLQAKHYLTIIPFRKKIIKIILVTIIPFFLLIYLKGSMQPGLIYLIIAGLLFLLVYIVLILITKCLDKNDFEILKSLRNKIKSYIPIRSK
jgi:O-antigen/teichoic acid export membrane protein